MTTEFIIEWYDKSVLIPEYAWKMYSREYVFKGGDLVTHVAAAGALEHVRSESPHIDFRLVKRSVASPEPMIGVGYAVEWYCDDHPPSVAWRPLSAAHVFQGADTEQIARAAHAAAVKKYPAIKIRLVKTTILENT